MFYQFVFLFVCLSRKKLDRDLWKVLKVIELDESIRDFFSLKIVWIKNFLIIVIL